MKHLNIYALLTIASLSPASYATFGNIQLYNGNKIITKNSSELGLVEEVQDQKTVGIYILNDGTVAIGYEDEERQIASRFSKKGNPIYKVAHGFYASSKDIVAQKLQILEQAIEEALGGSVIGPDSIKANVMLEFLEGGLGEVYRVIQSMQKGGEVFENAEKLRSLAAALVIYLDHKKSGKPLELNKLQEKAVEATGVLKSSNAQIQPVEDNGLYFLTAQGKLQAKTGNSADKYARANQIQLPEAVDGGNSQLQLTDGNAASALEQVVQREDLETFGLIVQAVLVEEAKQKAKVQSKIDFDSLIDEKAVISGVQIDFDFPEKYEEQIKSTFAAITSLLGLLNIDDPGKQLLVLAYFLSDRPYDAIEAENPVRIDEADLAEMFKLELGVFQEYLDGIHEVISIVDQQHHALKKGVYSKLVKQNQRVLLGN